MPQKILNNLKKKGAKMLRDGKFIKEDPPKIGAHYLPTAQHKDFTEEEWRTQMLLLGDTERKESLISDVVIWAAVFLLTANIIYLIIKGF